MLFLLFGSSGLLTMLVSSVVFSVLTTCGLIEASSLVSSIR